MTIKTKGITLFLLSPFLFLLILSVYAVLKFVFINLFISPSIIAIVNIVLGILAIISILGIPFGIYLLLKKDDSFKSLLAEDIYKSCQPEEVRFIYKVSWGAFINPFIWALGNKLYLWALGALIPIFSFYVWIKLFARGRQMAWKKGWVNFEQFKKRQIIMAWLIIISTIIFFCLIPSFVRIFDKFRGGAQLTETKEGQIKIEEVHKEQEIVPTLKGPKSGLLYSDRSPQWRAIFDPITNHLAMDYTIPTFGKEDNVDFDADSLPLGIEKEFGSSDRNRDTDGDGYSDKDEVMNGYDPNSKENILDESERNKLQMIYKDLNGRYYLLLYLY